MSWASVEAALAAFGRGEPVVVADSADDREATTERLSVLLDCPQLRRSSDAIAVSHVRGLDAAHALLCLMPGCVALLYGYELAAEDDDGYVTARPCPDRGGLGTRRRLAASAPRLMGAAPQHCCSPGHPVCKHCETLREAHP